MVAWQIWSIFVCSTGIHHLTHFFDIKKVLIYKTKKNNFLKCKCACFQKPRSNIPAPDKASAFLLGRKTQKFSGTNQKPERQQPFGTGLVRHCPQGLFSPFFTFLRAIFFCPFRLSLAPTICPWVSEDDREPGRGPSKIDHKPTQYLLKW